MSDETYYTVLNVKETASAVEIKTAYWGLIKQVHPDAITNLTPYLRKIAEDKAKEIIEAYGVLSNSGKRQDYDRQLAAYRRQSASQAPPTPQSPPTPQATPTPPPQQPSQCPICGRSDGGHSAACVNSRGTSTTTPTATAPQPKVVRWLGYNWSPLMRWTREHPFIVVFAVLFSVVFIASFFPDANTSQSPANQGQYSVTDIDQPPTTKSTSQSSGSKLPSTNSASVASTGLYSQYPCDFRDKISPIDGKPCSENHDQSLVAKTQVFAVDEKTTGTLPPSISVSGTYVGTVRNQTVNLSSPFAAVFHQTNSGALEGCMEVQPPLYGSGSLHGTMHGSHIDFAVADITFRGDASKSGIAGSYVVARQEGNQLGEFHLTKQPGAESFYHCKGGVLTAVPQTHGDVPVGYKVLPPAAKLTVESPNAPATDSKTLAETRVGPKQLDLSGMTSSERQSIEAACSHAKYIEGPAAYDRCLVRQFDAWATGPKEPDLSGLTSAEHQSIQAACSHAKYIDGPMAYDRCLVQQLQAWTVGPKRPDLSSLTSSERQSIEAACSHAKYIEGPAAYDRCLVRQLEALANYRQ
jgi:hypothetical protein